MDKSSFLPKSWLGSTESYEKSNVVMVGIPYDGTCSYRTGTRFAPEEIRLGSWGLEEYSPYQHKELDEVLFYDAGELDLPFGNRDKVLEIIKNTTTDILHDDKKYFGVGGEHLVTLPAVEAYLEKYPDLAIVHFDAHADLREDYLGEKLSHATVIRRIMDKISPKNLIQVGIRSGTKDEFNWMKSNNTFVKSEAEFEKKLEIIKNKPIFITLDLDVLDPSIMSGTGTPEPGGFTFNELLNWILKLKDYNIVGADVLELSPNYDNSGVSTAAACKIIRELLFLL